MKIQEHILIIEDDDIFRKALVDALLKEGYKEVKGDCNGEDAIKLAQTKPFDLIVADVRLRNG